MDELEHVESFTRGRLKLGSLRGYIEYKDSHEGMRGDQFDSLSQWLHPGRIEIEIVSHKTNLVHIVGSDSLQDLRFIDQHGLFFTRSLMGTGTIFLED